MNAGTSAQEFFKMLFTDSVVNSTVNQMVGICVMLGIVIATMLYFISLAQNYLKGSIGALKDQSSNSFVDAGELARTLVIIGMIVIYLPLINITTGTIDLLNRYTAVGTQEYAIFNKFSENYTRDSKVFATEVSLEVLHETMNSTDPEITQATKNLARDQYEKRIAEGETMDDPPQDEAGFWSSIGQSLTKIFDYITNPTAILSSMIYAAGTVILVPVKLIIIAITLNLWRLLIIVGPLALAFSVLPAFKNTINTWAGTYLNIGFVFTTLNIIDALMLKSIAIVTNNPDTTTAGFSELAALMTSVTYIILYLSSFWITSKFVGKGDGGTPITKLVGMAAAAAAIAMTGGAAAGAAASGQGGNVGSALNAASDITKNE